MKHFVKYIPGFVNSQDLKEIVGYAQDNLSDGFTEFGNEQKEFSVHTFQKQGIESAAIREKLTSYGRMVYEICVKEYGGEWSGFDEGLTHIAKFNEGYGMHEHFDSSKPNDIATLIYLNDDYEGGEIYFPDLGLEYKPKAGDLVMFPDNPHFVHGVKPILSGTRFTSPRWFTRSTQVGA
jgi:hypothetical protein